jgi:hypothetical protein
VRGGSKSPLSRRVRSARTGAQHWEWPFRRNKHHASMFVGKPSVSTSDWNGPIRRGDRLTTRLQQESNNDQVICCCLRTGLGVIGAGHAPGTPPTAGRDCHSSPRSMRTGYAPHCEWYLHQNSHPTCRQQVRSWSDLLASRDRRRSLRGRGLSPLRDQAARQAVNVVAR